MRILLKNISLNYKEFILLNSKSVQLSTDTKFLEKILDQKLT